MTGRPSITSRTAISGTATDWLLVNKISSGKL